MMSSISRYFLFALCFFSFCIEGRSAPKSLHIYLISWNNGVGLTKDVRIMKEELEKLGHRAEFIEINEAKVLPKADLNIYVETYNPFFRQFADKNYLLANPEWCRLSAEDIACFDKILCKTQEGMRIFQPLNPNTEFLGFTCRDCYDPNQEKDYKAPLHLVGASIQKGTDALARVWVDNPHFPNLKLIRHTGTNDFPPADNLELIYEYLPDGTLNEIRNGRALHICPSITEGFGHYIVESMSCANVILTTDAPPMNEFITDRRCLIKYGSTQSWGWATGFLIDPKSLERTVEDILSLPEEELREIGRKNRERYLELDRAFKERIAKIFTAEDLI